MTASTITSEVNPVRAAEYLILPVLLLFSIAFVIGITYAPCFSGLCVEEFYPFEARIHIAFFYASLAVTAIALTLRAQNAGVRRLSETLIWRREISIVGKRVSVGGLAMVVWIITIGHLSTVFWYVPQTDFYSPRADAVKWSKEVVHLVVVGFTGMFEEWLYEYHGNFTKKHL